VSGCDRITSAASCLRLSALTLCDLFSIAIGPLEYMCPTACATGRPRVSLGNMSERIIRSPWRSCRYVAASSLFLAVAPQLCTGISEEKIDLPLP
jgi:hypothetical protein